jgi:CelD/BcsL family acetyltransferase involved in cellulose biosynthesis
MPSISAQTLTDNDSFVALADEWGPLVAAMPRPSPFLAHGWLLAWWRHHGSGATLQVHIARCEQRLVGALPLFVSEVGGVRIARFIGARDSALADVLATGSDPDAVAGVLMERAASCGYHLLDAFGVPACSRLELALGARLAQRVEVVEAPVLDLSDGWDPVYRGRTTSKKRNFHARRRRQLERLGRLETSVARTRAELEPALEDAFRLHELRWVGRPDHSRFGTPAGQRFHRAAMAAWLELQAPRIVTLRLDGQAIAFHYYLAMHGRMYVHRLGFDPSYARYSPGLVNTLDALMTASAEGARRVEFLGGDERYKLELADGMEPLHRVLGLAHGVRGRALARASVASTRTRRRLKHNEQVNRLYYRGLAPARRLLEGTRTRTRPRP